MYHLILDLNCLIVFIAYRKVLYISPWAYSGRFCGLIHRGGLITRVLKLRSETLRYFDCTLVAINLAAFLTHPQVRNIFCMGLACKCGFYFG